MMLFRRCTYAALLKNTDVAGSVSARRRCIKGYTLSVGFSRPAKKGGKGGKGAKIKTGAILQEAHVVNRSQTLKSSGSAGRPGSVLASYRPGV
eukprot:scaffold147203_cov19-Tisochrysis_lutea.AAC.1